MISGMELNQSGLRRTNTCTTYVSVSRKNNNCAPVRSASFRSCNTLKPPTNPRPFFQLEAQPEESL